MGRGSALSHVVQATNRFEIKVWREASLSRKLFVELR